METGRTVILLNLENLYESLYDVLNQVSSRSLLCLQVQIVRMFVFTLSHFSIIFTLVRADMLILDYRHIESSVECMITSSKLPA